MSKRVSRSKNSRFAEVPRADIQRSSFDRSHGLKTTFDAGYLVPIYVDEALPGDTFNMSMNGFARLATPLKPIMDNLYLDTFFFAVPNRIIWDNWERFNGAQDNPADSTDFLVPTVVINENTAGGPSGDLFDHFGIPVDRFTGVVGAGVAINSLPARSYVKIWNAWFRDENLQDSIPELQGDGPDPITDFVMRRRGKRHDYFTSALPWPQKGDSVTIPLGSTAPVTGTGAPLFTDPTAANGFALEAIAGGPSPVTIGEVILPYAGGILNWADPQLEADLSLATATTINSLRQAFQIQKLLERDARGGTRYTEIIKSHFQISSDDARQQRPEYLGGGSTVISISPVAQTNSTESDVQVQDTPQGNLAAIGTASWSGHGWNKSFTEHCTIIGLASVRADLTYQQGIERMWDRSTRFDYYWPAFSHLGEQSLPTSEIYVTGIPAEDDVIFGYQERYAEYRYKPSQISGLFRSDDPLSLNIWHLAQNFTTPPILGDTFISETPPVDRILAVQDQPDFLFDAWFNLKCARPMPVYGVPGLIDHF